MRLGPTPRRCPRTRYPCPGARLSIPEQVSDSLRANLNEVISKQPPYDYDRSAATITVPKVEIIRLHEGALAAASTMKQQLAALDAADVSVVVGANGPSADDLNDYTSAVSAFGEIGRLMRASPDLHIGQIDVPAVQITLLLRGMRGANNAVDKLFELMAAHQLLDESGRLLAFHVDQWPKPWHVVESLDSFYPGASGHRYCGTSPLQWGKACLISNERWKSMKISLRFHRSARSSGR